VGVRLGGRTRELVEREADGADDDEEDDGADDDPDSEATIHLTVTST